MFSLDALFCHVDDFCKAFEVQWHKKLLKHGGIKRIRAKSLSLSEIMTIIIAFHQNARGKNSVDWFFGFKLHIVVNERGQLLNAILTPGNIDDRKPVPDLLNGLFGKIFADRGLKQGKYFFLPRINPERRTESGVSPLKETSGGYVLSDTISLTTHCVNANRPINIYPVILRIT